VSPVTLVATASTLFLLDDYHQLAPSLCFVNPNLRSTSIQFKLRKQREVKDLVGIEYCNAAPDYLGLCFEADAPNKLEVWALVAKGREEHGKALKVIGRLWSKLFRVPIPRKHVILK